MRSASPRAATAALLLALLAACDCGGTPPPPPPPPPPVGDGVTAWQLFSPDQYFGNTLTVAYPNLLSTERLAVLLVNAGGDDRGVASVSVVGTGNPSLAVAPLAAVQAGGGEATRADQAFDRSDVMIGEALVSARREETVAMLRDGRLQRAPPPGPDSQRLALAAAPLPGTRSFCQGQWGAKNSFKQVWKSATLGHETAHAGFYYTDEVKPGIDAAVAARTPVAPAGQVPFWGELGAAYEGNIRPALTTYFGPESDVDGNGKVIFLLADLGRGDTSFAMGYFWPGDLELPLATDVSCPGNATGNRADMLYLIDPGSFTANWASKGSYAYVLDLILSGDYPGVMAHELQHDVNHNTRCPVGGACGVREELWLDEGLSMLSETVSGYGLHTPTGRALVREYQGLNPSTGLPYYQGYGMTIWPATSGDPVGNYAGVQAFMQYLLDHATPAMTRALENRWLSGKANLEAATGLPFEVSFARFATAAMFSNEDRAEPRGALGSITSAGDLLANPAYNYLGGGYPGTPPPGDYVPWHRYTGSCAGTPTARVANVAYTPLASSGSATLRQDGWAAFATGPGSGGLATVTVESSAGVRPHVVVVKYAGHLPNYVAPTCP